MERQRPWLPASAGATVLIALAGLARVRTDVHLAGLLPPEGVTRQTLETWERVYGGYHVVQIEFDSGAANGVGAPTFLRYLDAVHRYAAARPEPTGVYSFAQVLALANQVWEGGRPEALRLPEVPLHLALFTAALRAGEFPFLAALADADSRTASLVVRTPHLPARTCLNLIADIVREAERLRPSGVTVSAARGLHTLLAADRQLRHGQAASALLAAGVIGLTLAVPVALALAGAGWAGVPLNSVTVMVGALALGVVVDDAVHLLTHWQTGRRVGLTEREALVEALRVKGPPVVWTSVILIGVCGLWAASSFPPVQQFGALLAGALAAALGAVLGWLPAWLRRAR